MHSCREELAQRKFTNGLGGSCGAACGAIVFTNEDAIMYAKEGKKCILVRRETSADDIGGLQVYQCYLSNVLH